MVRLLSGLYEAGTFRVWKITAPYSTKTYIYAGRKTDAEADAKKVFRNHPYKYRIREIKTI